MGAAGRAVNGRGSSKMDAKDAQKFHGKIDNAKTNEGSVTDPVIIGGPEIWKRVCRQLALKLDQTEYRQWIESLRFISEVDGNALIVAKTRFAFDRVHAHYFLSLIHI